jgi:hypothetical protein
MRRDKKSTLSSPFPRCVPSSTGAVALLVQLLFLAAPSTYLPPSILYTSSFDSSHPISPKLSLHEVIVDEWMLLFDFPSWADLASIAYVSLIIYHSIPPDAVWSHMEGRLRNVRRTWDYSALESCFSLDEGMHYSELEGDSEYDHDEGPAHQACLGHDPEANLTLVLRRDQEVDCWHDFEECGFKLIFRKE